MLKLILLQMPIPEKASQFHNLIWSRFTLPSSSLCQDYLIESNLPLTSGTMEKSFLSLNT